MEHFLGSDSSDSFLKGEAPLRLEKCSATHTALYVMLNGMHPKNLDLIDHL
jgi:ribulose bisphosphate carboxylase small subunit